MKLTVLGATGSIGVSTLDVVARHPDRFEVVALTGHNQVELLAAQCRQFRPAYAVVGSATAAQQLAGLLRDAGVRSEVLYGADALVKVASLPEVDAVMAAIVGAAGLSPALAAARAGKRLLLANKEALVMAGAVFMAEAADRQRAQCGIPVHAVRLFRRHDAGRGKKDSSDRFGRSVSHRVAGGTDAGDAGAGGGASQLGDGAQDFGRFGDHDEQGPRSDRGALAVQRAGREN
jgi:1-deoxy-D-xylulose-5-phosphate reductoisomerase